MEAFVNEVKMAYGDWRYILLSIALLVVGLIFLRGYKKRFIVPMFILVGVILNPLFYSLWYKFNDRSYWRMMWIIPIIPVCILVPSYFIEKSKKKITKIFTLILASLLVALSGHFVYDGSRRFFVEADNPEKLPEDVVAVGEALLEIDDDPFVITDSNLSVYLRQYSGKIQSPYGRSAIYGALDGPGEEMLSLFIRNDYSALGKIMANFDYEYLVINHNRSEKIHKTVENAGFGLLRQVNGYGIYCNNNIRTEKRTYNNLNQITSVTTVDEQGNPVIGNNGYATVEFEYGKNGRIVSESYFGVLGERIRNNAGFAVIKYNRDQHGNAIEERTYDEDYKLIPRKNGYSIVRREYDNKRRTITEKYYISENEMIEIGIGYSEIRKEYTPDYMLSLSWYFDDHGNRVKCGSSYFHEYLQSLQREGNVIFLSIKDEGTEALTVTLMNDLIQKLEIQTNLVGKYRNSYYAVITPDRVIERLSPDSEITMDGYIGEMKYSIASAGFMVGNRSSITINGTDYSKNVRGMNIVVYSLDEKRVTESISFDTCTTEMMVTR